jgi:hypothetical protein
LWAVWPRAREPGGAALPPVQAHGASTLLLSSLPGRLSHAIHTESPCQRAALQQQGSIFWSLKKISRYALVHFTDFLISQLPFCFYFVHSAFILPILFSSAFRFFFTFTLFLSFRVSYPPPLPAVTLLGLGAYFPVQYRIYICMYIYILAFFPKYKLLAAVPLPPLNWAPHWPAAEPERLFAPSAASAPQPGASWPFTSGPTLTRSPSSVKSAPPALASGPCYGSMSSHTPDSRATPAGSAAAASPPRVY